MQETKATHTGLINFDGYFTYEQIRSKKEGGGVTISALKTLQSVFVSDGGEDAEAVTIDTHVQKMAITITSAYGPQENAKNETKALIWNYLHDEAKKAKSYGKGCVIQGDLNAWLGPNMLPHDLHEQNRNGALFEKFLKENQLTCVNTLPLTEGLVTRKRKCLSEIKESTIDFYIVCERVLPFVTKMQIDDGKNHMVTNYRNINSDGNSVSSDHYPLII